MMTDQELREKRAKLAELQAGIDRELESRRPPPAAVPATVTNEMFDLRHGGTIWHEELRRFVCADGSSRDATGVIRFDPPRERADVLRCRVVYHQLWAATYEADFHALKGAALGTSGRVFNWSQRMKDRYGFAGSPDPVRTLTVIKEFVLRERLKIAHLEREIDSLPEVLKHRLEQAEEEARTRRSQQESAARQFSHEQNIRAVTLDEQPADAARAEALAELDRHLAMRDPPWIDTARPNGE